MALPDACSTQSHIVNGRLQDGEAQCLGNDDFIQLTVSNVNEYQSITNGDNVDGSSAGSDNKECIWLQNQDEYWGYLKITDSNGSTTIVVDFDSPTCRIK